MRYLMFIIMLTLGCATTENYHTNQDIRHPACLLSDEHVALVTQHFADSGININMRIDWCGPLSPPHSNLAYGLFETTGISKTGEFRHLITMIKFAQVDGKWVVVAEPELLVDLTQIP